MNLKSFNGIEKLKLLEPGQIGRLKIKNRIVMPAMGIGGLVQIDGSLSQRGIDYFVARAKGGVGLITTVCRVSRKLERVPTDPVVRGLVLDHQAYTRWAEELAESVHDYGAKLSVQLNPGLGIAISPAVMKKVTPIAPSAIPCLSDPSVLAHALTAEEIEQMVKDYKPAAEILGNAKVDAIELNCHAGYLVDQFMTSLWNKRTDSYGGDLDGRLRFLLEIVGCLKKVLGKDFPVIVKYPLAHYRDGGREIVEGVAIARKLEASGVDALVIDAGCRETMYLTLPSEFLPHGPNIHLAEKVKGAVQIPVITVGKIRNPIMAEEILQEGKADFVGLGRTLIADPEWPNKAKEKRIGDIRPCVGCFEGCQRRIHQGKTIGCAVNPLTGKETQLVLKPSKEKKSVLVIGGGPAGMEAARVAAQRGHQVFLWEKSNFLGGNLNPGSAPDFKHDYAELRDYLIRQLQQENVEIALGKEANIDEINELKPNVIFVATGSSPIIPNIKGVERENVVTAVDLLAGKKQSGNTVVIIGSGIVGSETALDLARKGKTVTLVEIGHDIARDMHNFNRMHLLLLLSEAKVNVLTETNLIEINDNGVVLVDKDGRESTLKADTVVLSVGMKPNNELVEKLSDNEAKVYAIGDCSGARKVIDAIWEGFRFARIC